ncbi:MAG: hydrogenase, partial [Synergistaceae bacterium]|nr:hydrogenase [Synergistaceae bacterium]
MWEKVYSGFGYWDVYLWLLFFAIASAVVLFIRSKGRSDYKEGTEQDEIFYGSNIVPEDGGDIAV